MRFLRNPVLASFAAFFAVSPILPGAILRFEWKDDKGSKGEFLIDTEYGISTGAFERFTYIDYRGYQTRPGQLPKSWTISEDRLAWDINPDQKGIVFQFSGPVGEPLPEDPAYYENHFEKSVYLIKNGMRTWETITVSRAFRNLILMKADPNRADTIYAIDYAKKTEGNTYLLRLKASTAEITGSVKIGPQSSDFTIDPSTNLLYVPDPGSDTCHVIDLATFSESQPIQLARGIMHIEADGHGRILAASNCYGSIELWDLATMERTRIRLPWCATGDFALSPDGRWLYRARYQSQLFKLDLSTNPATEVARTAKSLEKFANHLRFDAEKKTIAWARLLFDTNLELLESMKNPILDISPSGALFADKDALRWPETEAPLAPLPSNSEDPVAAFDSSGQYLLVASNAYYVPTTRLATIPVPNRDQGPVPLPGQSLADSPESFRWPPIENATSYTLVISRETSKTRSNFHDPLRFENIAGTTFQLPEPLPSGRNYIWKVTASTPDGETNSPAWRFSIRYPEPVPVTPESPYAPISLAFGRESILTGGVNQAGIRGFDPSSGATTGLQALHVPGNGPDDNLGRAVALDEGVVFVGNPKDGRAAEHGGSFSEFREDPPGKFRWISTFLPPDPEPNASFGTNLAASGGLLLAASPGIPGRVLAYLTQPSIAQTQILSPSNPDSVRYFGQEMAMHGNLAAIVAYIQRNRRFEPRVYIFERDPATGRWSEIQKINYYSDGINPPRRITSVAVSDDIIALGDTYYGIVEIFEPSSWGNQTWWERTATIKSADIRKATHFFGAGLALHRDLLLVGDPASVQNHGSHGAVFTFWSTSRSWIQGPTILSGTPDTASFGRLVQARDGWLLTGGRPLWLGRLDPSPNHTPFFTSPIPSQAVAGQQFRKTVTAQDIDGNDDLSIEAIHLPDWLTLTDEGMGRAELSGTTPASPGATFDIQLKVADSAGAHVLRTFRLTILSESDAPRIVSDTVPERADYGVGQRLVLRGEATGTAPFSWQWQRDGIDIPNANQPVFVIPQIGFDDAGSYTFSVSNAVAMVVSKPALVTVHPANRFAGPWPTPGANAQHSGFQPATLGRHLFSKVWEVPLPDYLNFFNGISPPIVADGKVFTTPNIFYWLGKKNPMAFDLETGKHLWTGKLQCPSFITPATWYDQRLYLLWPNGAYGKLYCLDDESGDILWTAPYESKDQTAAPPTVTERGIWTNGGGWGGLYRYTFDGQTAFLNRFSPASGWTPSASGERLFLCTESTFSERHPHDGSILWSLSDPDFTSNSPPVLVGKRALVAGHETVSCIDLENHSILWKQHGPFSTHNSANSEYAFVIEKNRVVSYRLDTGEPGPVYDSGVPESLNYGQQPLVLNDFLAVSNFRNTFVFDLANARLVQTLPRGGRLAYSDGYLVVASPDGKIHGFFANLPPALDANPQITLNRQTGIYEQTITVTNHDIRSIPGFDLTVSGLPDGVCVWNASDCTPGGATVEFRQPLAAGASVTLVLEYYAKARGGAIQPTITATLAAEPENDPPAPDGGLAIDRAVCLADGSMLVEFTATPGALYEVHYSPDGEHWKLSPVRIRAAGNRVQWIDRGPPRTETPPNDASARFYRVRQISGN